MSTGLVRELAAEGFPVAVTCRVLNIPRSSYYDSQGRAPSARAAQDAALSATIATVHAASRGTYGAPRVHAELRLGDGRGGRPQARGPVDASAVSYTHLTLPTKRIV